MKIVETSAEIVSPLDGPAVLAHLERCGRVCYKSEARIGEGSADAFVAGLVRRGHESVLEHAGATVLFVCDRGVSHEIVRHRIASYSQESTRYCNYAGDRFGNEITVVAPSFFAEGSPERQAWAEGCRQAEAAYFALLEQGRSPQEARSVLPHSLKTELFMTANLREWRHFFRLRAAPAAHPQIRELARPLLAEFHRRLPAVFEDIADPAG